MLAVELAHVWAWAAVKDVAWDLVSASVLDAVSVQASALVLVVVSVLGSARVSVLALVHVWAWVVAKDVASDVASALVLEPALGAVSVPASALVLDTHKYHHIDHSCNSSSDRMAHIRPCRIAQF